MYCKDKYSDDGLIAARQRHGDKTWHFSGGRAGGGLGSKVSQEAPLCLKLRERTKKQSSSSVDYGRAPRGLLQHSLWHAIDSREDERKCCVIWFLIQGS